MRFPKAFNREAVRVIVETPAGCRNKYKYDQETGMFKLHEILPSGFSFPCDMGFIPQTQGKDGDPLDALVLFSEGTFTGCLLECRLLGVIKAIQAEKNGKKFRNDRFIFIPTELIEFSHIQSVNDVNKNLIDALIKFFENYNKQEDRTFNFQDVSDASTALEMIVKNKK